MEKETIAQIIMVIIKSLISIVKLTKGEKNNDETRKQQ